jgi:alanine-glyoxylate transaminase / serine-glyoxylate transaminase / serine-pyruvate transaminase
MAQPIVGHLDAYFFKISDEIRAMLRRVYGTENELTFPISATGSGGMETAISNLVSPGTKVLVFCAGYFADRISEMARRHGGEVVRAEKPWGQVINDDEARDWIKRERPEVVAYVTAETSTGAFKDGSAICEAAHEVGAVVIADCVTSLGAMPINVDKTGIDVAFSCTQKGLSCPPGLSPVTVSPRAATRMKASGVTNSSWYFDLQLVADYLMVSHRYQHTAPITMFYALHQGLKLAEEEGFEARYKRHYDAHVEFVKGAEELGLPVLVREGDRIWNLNTPLVPGGVDDAKVRTYLLDKFGIEIAGGFGPLAGKIFRVGIMGPFADKQNVRMFLDRFAEALRANGYRN